MKKVNTKIWVSWERKELLRWNKSIFHHFWRAFIEANKTTFLSVRARPWANFASYCGSLCLQHHNFLHRRWKYILTMSMHLSSNPISCFDFWIRKHGGAGIAIRKKIIESSLFLGFSTRKTADSNILFLLQSLRKHFNPLTLTKINFSACFFVLLTILFDSI